MKVIPGTILGQEPLQSGPGTYQKDKTIYASVVGFVNTSNNVISVQNTGSFSIEPQVGSIVTGKIIKINPRFATVTIMTIQNQATSEDFAGIINLKDVRLTKTDCVEIYKCFRPGDIVRAVVIALGDQRNYILSTAENEFGVVLAQSLAGFTLVPVSWEQMICPETKILEYRKCAKP